MKIYCEVDLLSVEFVQFFVDFVSAEVTFRPRNYMHVHVVYTCYTRFPFLNINGGPSGQRRLYVRLICNTQVGLILQVVLTYLLGYFGEKLRH